MINLPKFQSHTLFVFVSLKKWKYLNLKTTNSLSPKIPTLGTGMSEPWAAMLSYSDSLNTHDPAIEVEHSVRIQSSFAPSCVVLSDSRP